LVPVQACGQVRQPLAERDMDALCAGCENTGVGFSVVVLEDLSNHAMHNLAQLSLLDKGTDKRQIVFVFRRCRVIFDVVIK
jgi:hypothetical protein